MFVNCRTFNHKIAINKLGITTGERLLALKILQKIAYACSERQYNQLYEEFITSVAKPILEYYISNWHPIRDEWVLGLKFATGSLMNRTNNRLKISFKILCSYEFNKK